MNESSQNFPVCPKHHEIYRNFCKSRACMVGLCPDCIDDHTQFHTSSNIKTDIISMRNMNKKCHDVIRDLISQIAKHAEEANSFIVMKRSQVVSSYQANLTTLRDIRVLLENIVKKFIMDTELKLKSVMHGINQMLSKPSENIATIQKYQALNQELDNPDSMIASITQVYQLEVDSVILKSKTETSKHTKTLQQFLIPLYLDQSLQQNAALLLEKSIQIGKYPTKSNDIDQLSPHKGFIRAKTIDLESSIDSYRMNFQRPPQSPNRKPIYSRDTKTQRLISDTIEISAPNFFKPNSQHKNLHYFQCQSKKLHLLPLQMPGVGLLQKDLDIRFLIPQGHQSISTPQGHIYLFGGQIPNSPMKSHKIYRFNFDDECLDYMGSMIDGRSNASLCYSNGIIYIIAGVISHNKLTTKCQTYTIATRQTEAISPCLQASSLSCVCVFGSDTIYKFGGVLQGNFLSNTIQKFDILHSKWRIIEPMYQKDVPQVNFLSRTIALQINKEQIIILGGIHEDGGAASQCITFNGEYQSITSNDKYQVPLGEGFNSGAVCIHNKMIHALENAHKRANTPDYKIIVRFDGYKWRTLG